MWRASERTWLTADVVGPVHQVVCDPVSPLRPSLLSNKVVGPSASPGVPTRTTPKWWAPLCRPLKKSSDTATCIPGFVLALRGQMGQTRSTGFRTLKKATNYKSVDPVHHISQEPERNIRSWSSYYYNI